MREHIESIAKTYVEQCPSIQTEDVEVTYWLRVTHGALLQAADRLFTFHGVDGSRPRYGIIRSLYFADERRLTHNDLVGLLGSPPSTITFMLDALEKQGLVARRPHPHNRRAAWVYLTDEGIRVAEVLIPEVGKSMKDMAECFSGDEKRQFVTLLERFYHSVENWPPSPEA
jgi:DNA-binding MarR family transcriptional regulator